MMPSSRELAEAFMGFVWFVLILAWVASSVACAVWLWRIALAPP